MRYIYIAIGISIYLPIIPDCQYWVHRLKNIICMLSRWTLIYFMILDHETDSVILPINELHEIIIIIGLANKHNIFYIRAIPLGTRDKMCIIYLIFADIQ